jgi:hypothetical protein
VIQHPRAKGEREAGLVNAALLHRLLSRTAAGAEGILVVMVSDPDSHLHTLLTPTERFLLIRRIFLPLRQCKFQARLFGKIAPMQPDGLFHRGRGYGLSAFPFAKAGEFL